MDPELQAIFGRVFGGNFQPNISSICSNESGEGGGEGGEGGEGGSGVGEKPFNPEQMRLLNRIVHTANSKTVSTMEGMINAASEKTSGDLFEIKGLLSGLGDKGGDKGGGDGGGNLPSWKDSDEYKASEAHRKASNDRLAAIEAERKDEVETRNRGEERSALEAALRKGGVEETRIRGALSLLINDEKVMKRDKEGAMFYQIQRDGYTEDLTVEGGVADYLSTDEGKSLLPSSGARGTGAKGESSSNSKKNQQGQAKQTKGEAMEVLMPVLFGQ